MIVCLAVTACALAPASAGASVVRPPVSLVASPSRVTLVGRARQTIRVLNSGTEPVVIDVTRAGFTLDLRGRPRIAAPRGGPRPAAPWLRARPTRLAIAPRAAALLTVSSAPPARAEPGDHGALVLLTTRPHPRHGLAVRMRLGVVVAVRVPGRVVRRLAPLALRVRRVGAVRVLELLVANRGNVTELLDRGCVIVTLRRRGEVLGRLRLAARQLLPRTRGLVEARYAGRVHGRLVAQVDLAARKPCLRAPRRTFSIRL
jgi:hypothetical protein